MGRIPARRCEQRINSPGLRRRERFRWKKKSAATGRDRHPRCGSGMWRRGQRCSNQQEKRAAALTRKCIPDSNSQIEEIGTARIVLVDGVGAAQKVYGEEQRFGQIAKTETQAGTGFNVVGPVLMQPVRGGVAVPIELRLQSAESLRRRRMCSLRGFACNKACRPESG